MNGKSKLTFVAAILAGISTTALADGRVYVPVGDADSIVVIDADTDRVIGSVAGTVATHGMAGFDGGAYLVVGSYAESETDATGAPAKPEGMAESEHLSHHAKRTSPAITANDSTSTVSIVRTVDRKIVRKLTVPGVVHHVETTPDGRFAALTLPNNDAVAIVDLRKYELAKLILTGPTPNYAVAAPDGKTIYVSNAGNNTVSEVDLVGGFVRRNFPVGETPEHMVLARDGRTLYVANADGGTVTALSLPDGETSRTIPIGGGLHGIDVADDGKTLFVIGREEGKLVAIDLEDGAKRESPLAPEPYHLAAIRGTGKLYVASAEKNIIWVVDEKTLRPLREIPVPDRAHQMVLSTQ